MSFLIKRLASLGLLTFALAIGCAGASTGANVDGAESAAARDAACSDKRNQALKVVEAAYTANMACEKDTDCEVVGFSASCFDACGRSMAIAGREAYAKAREEAEAKYCAPYAKDGCPQVIPPPCVSNPPPSCKEHVCN